jgi:hypothetical protein
MARTKWMRLLVRDLADVVRWASQQNARQIDNFRYRVVGGCESVSFRLVPDYAIEVGTSDIVVICHVRAPAWRRAAFWRAALARLAAPLRRRPAPPTPAAEAPLAGELAALPWVRMPQPSSAP